MCLEKYTLDVRNLGQAEGAHKVGASARTSRKPRRADSDQNVKHFVSRAKRSKRQKKRTVRKIQSSLKGIQSYLRVIFAPASSS